MESVAFEETYSSENNAKSNDLGVKKPGSHLGNTINFLCDCGKDTSLFWASVPLSESTELVPTWSDPFLGF